jgi:HK97 family phage prohead protease
VKDADGSVTGCHATKQAALKQLAALYASEEGGRGMAIAERAKYQVVEGAPGCPEGKPWGVVGEDGKRLEGCGCHATEEGAKGHMSAYFAGKASAPMLEVRRPEIRGHELATMRVTEFRQVGEDGKRQAEVVVCTYNVVDDYGTVWLPGCWTDGLRRKPPKVVWGHDWLDIIGRTLSFTDSDKELRLTLQFSDFEAVPRARQAWTQLRDGDVDEFSFSFDRERWENVDMENPPEGVPDGARELMSQAFMIEASPVLLGAVPMTRPLAVRAPGSTVVPIAVATDLALRVHAGSLDITDALIELRSAAVEDKPPPEPEPQEPPEDPREPEQPTQETDPAILAAIEAEADGALSRLTWRANRGQRGAIPSHDTPVRDDSWDGPATVAAMPNDEATLTYCHAWKDSAGDPEAKSSYKGPHHRTKGGPAIAAACRNGLARLSQMDIPAGDKASVERHFRSHLDKFNQ